MGKRLIIGSSALLSSACLLATPSMAAASSTLSISHAPMIRAKVPSTDNGHGHGGGHGGGGGGTGGSTYGWESSNWSGYALTGTTYNDITGTWTVPVAAPSRGNTYSSTWIGIDGFNNSNLIQTGTEQDYVNGKAQYNAWWEILPAPETPIKKSSNGQPATVKPGDQMSATIHNNGDGTWTITISDDGAASGSPWKFSTTEQYNGPASSAEWIQEAPTVGGHVATLADYGTVTMNPGTVNGGGPGLAAADDGAMVQKHSIVSAPSVPDSDKDGFNVEYGPNQPNPPAS